MSVEDLGELLGRGTGHPVYPVVDGGRLTGMLLVRDAGAVPVADRPRSFIGSLMRRRDVVPVVDADAPATAAVALLRKAPGRALVTDRPSGDTLVGVVAPTDLTRALEVAGPRRWPGRASPVALVIAAVATLAVLVGAAAFWHPPLAVVAPGQAVDVGAAMRLDGVPTRALHGRYLATPLLVTQPSLLGLAGTLLHGDRQVTAAGAVLPVGATAQALTAWQRASARETGLAAAAAAARAAGLPASLTGSGVRVTALVGDTAARGTLRVGDRIVGLDGTRVGTATDLAVDVARAPHRTTFALTVLREGRPVRLRVDRVGAPVALGDALGVLGTTVGLRASLPFRLEYATAPSRLGASAGLALALAMTDRLDAPDLARGRTVAAAGLVSPDGRIGAADAMSLRTVVARDAGAGLLIGAPPTVANGPVRGVGAGTLRDAVAALEATP